MGRIANCFLLVGFLGAAPCWAQEAQEREIIVEGAAPLDPGEVAELVRDGYSPTVMRNPIMRYHDPVCLQVNGLGPSGDAQVLEHMRETVRSLGIPLSSEGCNANAVVVVSVEPVAQLESIRERSPRVLSGEQLSQSKAEFLAGAHATVWHNRTIRGSDGEVLAIAGDVAGWTGYGGLVGLVNNNGRPSRVRAGYSLAADVGVVIYDANRLDNVELQQLANNAVMRLLAPGFAIDVERGSPETVLSGVENGVGPVNLTRFDRAMLTALYAMPPNQLGTALARATERVYETVE